MKIITSFDRGVAETTRRYVNTGVELPPIYRHTAVSNGFTKPDKPTRNPKVDGFRKPSTYGCPALLIDTGGRTHTDRLGVSWDIDGLTFTGNPSSTSYMEWNMRGRICDVHQYVQPEPNINNLRMKILNNIRSEVFDVAMVLAEAKSTADTVSNGLMRIARSMDMVKRRKPESFYYLMNGRRRDHRRPTDKFLRETAGSFLEWKYGVMPTVYDIQGACKGLDMNEAGSLFSHPPLLVARSKDILTGNAKRKFFLYTADGDGSNVDLTVDYYTERKARCDYRVSGEGLRGLNRYGLGLGTIATVAFDKTPFSFVLNMAIPIADLIKAWTALAGVEVVGYCETTYRKAQVRDQSYTENVRNGPVTLTVKGCPERVGFQRVAYSSPPMPLPYVRNPIKVGNLATVLALFTQLRKST